MHDSEATSRLRLARTRILFCLREDSDRKPGGDSIQIRATADALRRLGDHCEVSTGMPHSVSGYDIVHLTNLDRPHEMLAIATYLRGTGFAGPIFLSTIHHPDAWTSRVQAVGGERFDLLALASRSRPLRSALNFRRVRSSVRSALPAWSVARIATKDTRSAQLELLRRVDGCIALSGAEVGALQSDFDYSGPVWVVPNGIDADFLDALTPAPPDSRAGIAVVGRIERRKNSLALVRVLAECGLPAVFMGQLNRNERAYCAEFQRAVRRAPNVEFIGAVSRQEVARRLSRARLHVLASLAEVFPLVDLEALASGCSVITTRYSLSTSLLEGIATVVDPGDLTADIVRRAYERPLSPAIAARVRSTYTWDVAAERLRSAYQDHARAIVPPGQHA